MKTIRSGPRYIVPGSWLLLLASLCLAGEQRYLGKGAQPQGVFQSAPATNLCLDEPVAHSSRLLIAPRPPSGGKGINGFRPSSNLVETNSWVTLPSAARPTNGFVLPFGGRIPPGLYSAKPWSGLVLVPAPMDESIVVPRHSADDLAQRLIRPPLYLEPRR